jgi:acyl-coenzyme A thioesterase PaaI-like protein
LSEPEVHALVDDLRDILERISDRELEPAAALRAREHAAALLAELDGPRRTRWYEVDDGGDLFEHARAYVDKMSPWRGKLNGVAVPFDVRWADPESQRVTGHVSVPRRYEGPPHAVHGGVVAGLFDDLLGGVQALAPPIGLTAKLEITYRQPTPVETELLFEGWVHDNGERHMRAKGTCHAGGTLTAEATALFIRVDFKEIEERGRGR